KLLNDNNISNYQLFLENHQNIKEILKDYVGKISLVNFNLGYLPGGKKEIATNYKSTIKAISESLELLNNKGIILVTVYPGHEEGLKEKIELEKYIQKLNDYQVNYYYNTDYQKAPYLIEIKKNL